MYSTSTLILHGLPFDFDSLREMDPPLTYPWCNAALTDPSCQEPLHVRLFIWQ
jgi:hypothetical protein